MINVLKMFFRFKFNMIKNLSFLLTLDVTIYILIKKVFYFCKYKTKIKKVTKIN